MGPGQRKSIKILKDPRGDPLSYFGPGQVHRLHMGTMPLRYAGLTDHQYALARHTPEGSAS